MSRKHDPSKIFTSFVCFLLNFKDNLEDKLLDIDQLLKHEKDFKEKMQKNAFLNIRAKVAQLETESDSTLASKVVQKDENKIDLKRKSSGCIYLLARFLIKLFEILFWMWFGAFIFHQVDQALFPDEIIFEE
jgi:hypothetical protein